MTPEIHIPETTKKEVSLITHASELTTVKNLINAHNNKAIFSILLGGTPYPPNARLAAYLMPAIETAIAIGRNKISLILASTVDGGVAYNYEGKEQEIRNNSEKKITLLTNFIETFFQGHFRKVIHYNQHLPVEENKWEKLWEVIQITHPAIAAQYQETANGFTEKGQNADQAGLYGVRHAFWARDVVFSEERVPKQLNQADCLQVSFGGEKEEAFNEIRHAVKNLGEDKLAKIFQTPINVREHVLRVVTPFGTPVPYGRACYNHGRKKKKVRKVADVELRAGANNPFAVRGPKSIRKEMQYLVEKLAQLTGMNTHEAAVAYADFWRKQLPKDKTILTAA
jgi:hypothetical protein